MREMLLMFSIGRTSSELFLIPSLVEKHGETSSDLASVITLCRHRLEATISPVTM